MNEIIVIGGGVSAWAAANAFSHKNIKINLIYDKEISFGAQQISPNGLKSYVSLTNNKSILNKIEKINNLKISQLKKNNFYVLSNYNFSKNYKDFGSISRKILVNELKKSALKNKNVSIIKEKVKYFKNSNNKLEILTDKGNVFSADIFIGADGYKGISRKYVTGSSEKRTKKIFRSISNDLKKFILTKDMLQLFLTTEGHYVVYPFKEKNQKLVNYIFVPNSNFQKTISKHTTQNLNPLLDNIKWELTYTLESDNEFFSVSKNNLFLFGDSAFPIPPHLAQGGNQILEDANFLKEILNKNQDVEHIILTFLKKRLHLKKILRKNSIFSGKVLGLNNIYSLPRNIMLSNFSNSIFDEIFDLIWNNNYEK